MHPMPKNPINPPQFFDVKKKNALLLNVLFYHKHCVLKMNKKQVQLQ